MKYTKIANGARWPSGQRVWLASNHFGVGGSSHTGDLMFLGVGPYRVRR